MSHLLSMYCTICTYIVKYVVKVCNEQNLDLKTGILFFTIMQNTNFKMFNVKNFSKTNASRRT